MKGLFYMFKKIALVIALLLSVSACSGSTVELLDFIGDSKVELDFERMTFRIFHTGDQDLRYIDKEANASSLRKEKLLSRLDEVEDKYNCTILTLNGEHEEFSLKLASNIPVADFYYESINYSYPRYLAGCFIPLNEIPTIDLHS